MSSGQHDLFNLHGQVAIVTGGGTGIGRALAFGLAEAGMDIVLASRHFAPLDATAREIRRLGRRALPYAVDLVNRAGSAELVEETISIFGRLDLLVNCAGRVSVQPALDVTEEEWQAVVDINLKGLFFSCQAAARAMIGQDHGKIINVASALGLVGLEHRAVYSASKGGVIQLTRALAVEWAPHHINVNAIAPTTTLTGETARLFADPAREAEKARDIPQLRLGRPRDLVGAAIYLASPAADFVTGHTLVVDGGYSIH